MNDAATTLDRLVAKAGQLHSLPAVAMEVLRLTDNPQVDARALKECIENDPALTGKLLRVVNSSLFGLSRQVSDLNQALALLGTKPLKLLVLGFSLPSGLFADIEARTLGRYWRHTLTKAVAGREISQRFWHIPGDDAFIAGLLQDLGRLLLLQQLGEPYARFLDRVLANGMETDHLETEALGFTHTALGARLLAQWHLPANLVEAIAADPRQPPEDASPSQLALPKILHLAELVARLLADGQTAALAQLLDLGQDYRQLQRDELITLLSDLEEKVQQLAAVLSLQLPGGVQYVDILAEAQRQLACVASQAALDLMQQSPAAKAAQLPEEALLGDLRELAQAVAGIASGNARGGTPVAPPSRRGPAPNGSTARAASTRGATVAPAGSVRSRAHAVRTGNAELAAKADPGLLGRLGTAVTACRQSRCPLSLLLVELDDTDELLTMLGVDGFDAMWRRLETDCRGLDHPRAISTAYGEAGFAIILPNCERRQAVQWGDQLQRDVRRFAGCRNAKTQQPIALSVGVATVVLPPKNFLPQDLLAGAERCLYGSRVSGGGVVKSIEIY